MRRVISQLANRLWIVLAALGFMLDVEQARADDKRFRLSAPAALVETGLLDYLLPRFSLKTGVRIEVVGPVDPAEMTIGPEAGRAVFKGEGGLWRISRDGDHPGAARFADWLTSEIGQRTVTSYEVAGRAVFTLAEVAEEAEVTLDFDGNASEGKRVSLVQCGRCHVVAPENRMNAMGSTPSFAVLRTMPDWAARFQSFYVLRPHAAFTQVEDVTAPFPINRPSPIVPVEVTLDEVEAILAYVAEMAPADLGAPIQVQ
ncbi:hypothetical protein RA2_00076 [Roseovarius sp. A-2]|uniref:hypothetical protein n=1 Tax=Roseovarius sp. A-2 TaxID=1570360 RepID=UPI0009B53FA1|nr:hypothetical protein [Roseovarius sp. A-2]GAW33040.1 hypothetical protein RA2_00076 [Roseovarius sp. A-2]